MEKVFTHNVVSKDKLISSISLSLISLINYWNYTNKLLLYMIACQINWITIFLYYYFNNLYFIVSVLQILYSFHLIHIILIKDVSYLQFM